MTNECRKCGKKFEADTEDGDLTNALVALDPLCDDCSWEDWYDAQLERAREFDEGVA